MGSQNDARADGDLLTVICRLELLEKVKERLLSVTQCFGNAREPAKGRQMPIHYGSAALNFHTIGSSLATQLPHAVGAAYALKVALYTLIWT